MPKEKTLTFTMQYYLDLKKQYGDAIIFYRMGDFYEIFFEDAITISKVLNLTLTSKSCGLDEKAPMCGVPYHAVDNYIAKLINEGYKVAICDQVGEVVKNQIVDRQITRIITPGTVVDETMIENNKNNYIACLFLDKNKTNFDVKELSKNWENLNQNNLDIDTISSIGIAYSDISTGEFSVEYIEQKGEKALIELFSILNRFMPSEIVVSPEDYKILKNYDLFKQDIVPLLTTYYDYAFDKYGVEEVLKKHFSNEQMEEAGLSKNKGVKIAAGALLIYITETQKRSLKQINKISLVEDKKYLKLDASARRNLEITETFKDRRKKGTLLFALDKTSTSMGARLFRNWLVKPLQDEVEINSRLDAVEELANNIIARDQISKALNEISDIERIAGRVAYGNFTPKDAISLINSFEKLPQIKNFLSNFYSFKIVALYNKFDTLADMHDLLFKAIDPEAPALLKELNVIKWGYNQELDNLRRAKNIADDLITKLEEKEKSETGIKNLKISYNRVFGYYIEVPKLQSNLVPFRYSRKQTTANTERYITEDLKMIEEKVLGSHDEAIKLQNKLFKDIVNTMMANLERFQSTSQVIAELDCLASLATIAVKNNYCKPIINSKINHIKIVNGRHPVVEEICKSRFVPNDVFMNDSTDKTLIITGPNMAGKSTYMRQTAIITLMAHIGSFVPAESAEISIVDQIFTRVGASDDLAYGQSTFMVEMSEVSNILRNATDKSLVILDEVGRGTSTFDGLSIAWALMEYISNKTKFKTLFSTHYHELTELEGLLRGVKNYRITVKENGDDIIFLRKVVRGGANRSFGIAVAKLAGLPNEIISRAKEISKNLENADINKKIADANIGIEPKEENSNYNEIIDILKTVDVNMITPFGALEMLADLVSRTK